MEYNQSATISAYRRRIAALRSENEQLQNELERMELQLASMQSSSIGLQGWAAFWILVVVVAIAL